MPPSGNPAALSFRAVSRPTQLVSIVLFLHRFINQHFQLLCRAPFVTFRKGLELFQVVLADAGVGVDWTIRFFRRVYCAVRIFMVFMPYIERAVTSRYPFTRWAAYRVCHYSPLIILATRACILSSLRRLALP